MGAAELEVEWNKQGPVSLSLLEDMCTIVSTHIMTSDLQQVSSVGVELEIWCMLVNEKRSVLCTQDPGDSRMLTAELSCLETVNTFTLKYVCTCAAARKQAVALGFFLYCPLLESVELAQPFSAQAYTLSEKCARNIFVHYWPLKGSYLYLKGTF